MTDMHEHTNLEELYGPLYQYSDYKKGDPLRYYHADLKNEQTGTILWVAGPQELAGRKTGVQYIVEPKRGGMPDVITPSDIIIE